MIKVSINSSSKLGLISLIVKLKHFSVIFFNVAISSLRVIILVIVTVDHLDLVVQQPHGCNLLL